MPLKKLREYLDSNKVKYEILNHPVAYTAQYVASTAHIPGGELAKTVIVKCASGMKMVVLPASYEVNFKLLKELIGEKVELASEAEFRDLFPDCELGAMPPFGNLYDMDVYVTKSLSEDEEIAFNACSHTQLIKLAYTDFERLVKPKVAKFSTR
ncbi:MAG: YbaK/EbsC family protein [Candidatus Neomarinimicrobiota bacterium]